ncbi:nucleoid-associated protein [Sporanaerobacter acetigenes]|uniref:nucleoid-associated protein n=1 Tax=Sporanaerobacter acetigenes TaxID=165813 RepID=UPI00104F044A|nr:hypothetical protein [Sporanaerobacter acetigenes]
MACQFENLCVEEIVIHQIFERNLDREIQKPFYNDDFTKLEDNGLFVLQERITDALGKKSNSMEMNIIETDPGSTFSYIANMLHQDGENYIEISKQVAYNLAKAQNRRNIPGGIVVILRGTVGIDNKKFIGIIKAEIQEGFVLENQSSNLILNYVSDLLLTPEQKFYKIGIYINENDYNIQDETIEDIADKFTCYIYDKNMSLANTDDAAQYFYGSFLGCTFLPLSQNLTRDFYNNTKEFIDTNNHFNNEDKIDLNYALYTYLNTSKNNIISVDQFATEYLEKDVIDLYSNYMELNGVSMTGIQKDLNLIKKTLKKRRIKFSSNVNISAPSENFKDIIEISKQKDDWTFIKVKGIIEKQD